MQSICPTDILQYKTLTTACASKHSYGCLRALTTANKAACGREVSVVGGSGGCIMSLPLTHEFASWGHGDLTCDAALGEFGLYF